MVSTGLSIATSIAPSAGNKNRILIQQRAIESWLSLGFRVASLNCPEEIDQLADAFPGVAFMPQMRTGQLIAGKPVIYINDILQYFRTQPDDICAIVNSDIYFKGDDNFCGALARAAKGGLVYGPRIEVPDFDADEGTLDPFGFDYFFFDRALLTTWTETSFCLGMPFWDHWFPLMPILAGAEVRKISDRFALHIPHPTSRDDSFFAFNDAFASLVVTSMKGDFGDGFPADNYTRLRQAVIDAEAPDFPKQERDRHFTNLAFYFDELTKYVIKYLADNSEEISLD